MNTIQIKSIFGNLLFEHECENNTIKKTLEKAILLKINIKDASFLGCDFTGFNFSNLNLQGCDFHKANLSNTKFNNTNLSWCDLSVSNLTNANLLGANLEFANITGANLLLAKTDKRYIQIAGIGSKKRMTTYCFEDDLIYCCHLKVSLRDFENIVKETHVNNNQYLKEYLGFINYLKYLKDDTKRP